jgi:hypothetical protein
MSRPQNMSQFYLFLDEMFMKWQNNYLQKCQDYTISQNEKRITCKTSQEFDYNMSRYQSYPLSPLN